MKIIKLIFLFFLTSVIHAETSFTEMLKAAESGDSMARVTVGYAYYYGKYRDGTLVEQNYNVSFAWASLANYQGNAKAQRLVDLVKPKLENRDEAVKLATEYFKKYGAKPETREEYKK